MYKIIAKKELNPQTHLMIIEAEYIVKNAMPGQFVILRVKEQSERIPLTIFETDKNRGTVSVIFQELGKSTMEMGKLKAGDMISDIVGPLGEPTHIADYGRVVCVAGGVGTAEIYPVARALKEKGNFIIAIIGSRCRELIVLAEEMKEIADEFYICTDDGSLGRKGLVTDVLKDVISCQAPDMVFAVGPIPMMKAVAELTRPAKIKTIVSLNSIMVDGTGMCGSCRVSIGGETRFVCVDGPDFDAHRVDFDELAKRQGRFRKWEEASLEHFKGHRGCGK